MTDKFLIAIVLPDLRLGGGQRVLLELARQFLEIGHQVDVICLVDDGELRGELPSGARYRPLIKDGNCPRARLFMRALPALVRYLWQAKPGAVLSSMTGTNLFTVLAHRLAKCPGRLVLREAVSLQNTSNPWVRFLMRWLYPCADAIVAVSSGVAAGLGKLGIDPCVTQVILNPIDRDRIRGFAASARSFSVMEPYVISIGRLIEQKDHRTLLRAYAESALRQSHRLVVVGEGSERSALERMIFELGVRDRVDLLGGLANPYPLLSGAGLHVLSSRWEGYPNVLLEALALGVPVVATDCPFGPRELLRDGRCGRLVPIGDAAALAKAMDEELHDPSAYGSELFAEHHPRTIAMRYLEVLCCNPEGDGA